MPLLNQMVALEKGMKIRTQSAVTVIYQTMQKSALFTGLSRVYRPKDEDGDVFPPEQTQVQLTVAQQLDEAAHRLTELFDVVATKEHGNLIAKADVTVNGQVVLAGAPVPYLLFLEKQLTDWRTLVSSLPVLDPAEVWTFDEDNKQYRTDPTETVKTKKVLKALTLAPATDKHPAQTQTYNDDVVIGRWETTKFSGAVPRSRRDELVDKANTLLDAVKAAIQEANSIEVEQKKGARAVFSYLLS